MNRRFPRAHGNHPGDRAEDNGPRHPNVVVRAARSTGAVGCYRWLRRYVLPATFWSFAASAVAVYALVIGIGNQDDILRGRRIAIGVTCAVESAIAEAGQRTIANPMPLPPRVEKLLVSRGFPPYVVRELEAQRAAKLYARAIAKRVERQVGGKAVALVRPDGTLDCSRLARVTRTR